MAKNYYRKELVSNRVFVNGSLVDFEILPGNRGVIELDSNKDAPIIAHLNQLAERRKLGIAVINAEQYAELKKKAPSQPSRRKSLLSEPLRVHNPLPIRRPSQQKNTLQAEVARAVDAAIAGRVGKATKAKPASSTPAPAVAAEEVTDDEAPVAFKPAVGAKQGKASSQETE